MAVNDEIFKNLAQYGGGTINERVYNFLGSLGYTGTINDRLGQFEEGGRKGWQGLIRAWGQWAPAQLFSQGQQGVWYEPRPEYLFQDAAGTTPVTADGDPVGLMLDRSRGLVLGPELVANGAFDANLDGWTFSPNSGHWQWQSGRAYHPLTDVYNDMRQAVSGEGTYTEIKFDIERIEGTPNFIADISGGSVIQFSQPTSPGVISQRYVIEDLVGVRFARTGTNAEFYIDNVSIKELPGNHATQSTSAARPIYRTDGVLHWLEGDGVDDHLKTAPGIEGLRFLTGYTGAPKFTTAWAFATRDLETANALSAFRLADGGTGRTQVGDFIRATGEFNHRIASSDASVIFNNGFSNRRFVASLEAEPGTGWRIWVNGITTFKAHLATTPQDMILEPYGVMGAGAGTLFPVNAAFFGMVAYAAEEKAQVRDFLTQAMGGNLSDMGSVA